MQNQITKNLVIIGGGASGLFAACIAGEKILKNKNNNKKINIIVLDRMDKVGKKLLATGNGRCNLTNNSINYKDYFYTSNNTSNNLVNNILDLYSPQKAIEFFEQIGVSCKVEEESKVYPKSDQASSVLDCLRFEAQKYNVQEICEFNVSRIINTNNKFKISSNNTNQKNIIADAIIIASGGQASPALGSNGSGYALLKSFGHTVTKIYPAIVHVKTFGSVANSLKGMKIIAQANLIVDENNIAKSFFGEVLFSEFGLSGPPIFRLSSFIAEAKINNHNLDFNFTISLDLFCDLSLEKLTEKLVDRSKLICERPAEHFFTGLINKRVSLAIFKSCNISFNNKQVQDLTSLEIKTLAKKLKNFIFEVEENMPFLKAQTTAGGVRISEFSENIESKFCRNLFASGEVLDATGDCGGFNLQWAWASGFAAANGAVDNLLKLV